jgi:hypothetical protein
VVATTHIECLMRRRVRSQPRARRLAIGCVAVLALGQACGADEGGSPVQAADGAGAGGRDAGACVSQSCSCGTLTGVRSCSAAGVLGSCECDAGAPIFASPLAYDASVSSSGACVTGLYTGNFEGEAGFFIAVGAVSGFDLFEEAPPLQITLATPEGASELGAVVGDGKMRGTADGLFPFEATIKGMLDCTTKQFKATLMGSVQLVLDGVLNHFTGTMTATYDSQSQTFTNGTWTVTGSEADGGTDFGLTGTGTWMASYARDGAGDAGL